MDIRNMKNHIFNFKLAKITGLYQMLNPDTIKCRGRNIYHVVISCVLIFKCLATMILILSGLYYWTVNIPMGVDYFWKTITTFFMIYKTWIIIRHSNDIWNYLSITRYDFTSLTNQYRHILDHCRELVSWSTTIYAIVYFLAYVCYLGITLAFSEDKSPVKNHDGSIGYYRQNVMNFYLIVSDETYNAHYYTLYFIESLFLGLVILFYLIFDILLVTLCFSMCCQMEIICSAFELIGHKSARDSHSPIVYTDGNTNITSNERDLIWDELKTILMDHQAVMEKYKDFLSLFRRMMLPNIFMLAVTLITLSASVIMSLTNDDRFKTSEVLIKKMFCAIPTVLFQLFMMCFLFENLHEQKDSIIFALYSSNWTDMDMKCKKLILLTMQLNNANQKKLQFTRTRIISLEMFFKTMGNCYSIISLLVNYI